MAEEKVINELTKIKGLNKKAAIKIFRAGVKSIKKLGSSNPDELSKITGIAKKQLTTWIILARAQERKKFIEVDTAAAELSQLVEVKLEDAKRLVGAGVMSIEDLADESSDLLSEDTGLSSDVIQKWIKKAKEIKKLPPEKRKIVVVPSAEATMGSKLSGAFFGSSSGLSNIYHSSSFGQSLVFVLLTSILFWFYLSMSQAEIFGWKLAELWAMTQLSIEIQIGSVWITFYPLVLVGGMVLVLVVWLLLGKIIASTRNLEFKNTSAVLGFTLAPGVLAVIVVIGKFIPAITGDLRTTILPVMLGVFGVWAAITFIRGMAFSPRGLPVPSAAPDAMKVLVQKPTRSPAETTLEVERETAPPFTVRPPPTPATAAVAPPAAPPAAPAVKKGPVKLENFGLIPANEVVNLQNAGFHTSIDLLRTNSKDISSKTGIAQSKIIIWRIISDLLRIPGMTIEYAMILAKSGVRSVKHLSKINENALKVQVLDTISKEGIATSITANVLSDWIAKAKSL